MAQVYTDIFCNKNSLAYKSIPHVYLLSVLNMLVNNDLLLLRIYCLTLITSQQFIQQNTTTNKQTVGENVGLSNPGRSQSNVNKPGANECTNG